MNKVFQLFILLLIFNFCTNKKREIKYNKDSLAFKKNDIPKSILEIDFTNYVDSLNNRINHIISLPFTLEGFKKSGLKFQMKDSTMVLIIQKTYFVEENGKNKLWIVKNYISGSLSINSTFLFFQDSIDIKLDNKNYKIRFQDSVYVSNDDFQSSCYGSFNSIFQSNYPEFEDYNSDGFVDIGFNSCLSGNKEFYTNTFNFYKNSFNFELKVDSYPSGEFNNQKENE